MTNDNYTFDLEKNFVRPQVGNQEEYREYITSNFETVDTGLFGLHPNAEIVTNQSKSEHLLASILSVQPRVIASKKGKSQEDI